jgi:hypothetical protein
MPKITDKFKINKISEKTVLNKKDQTIKVFRKDKKKMTMSDIKEFFNHIKKEFSHNQDKLDSMKRCRSLILIDFKIFLNLKFDFNFIY